MIDTSHYEECREIMSKHKHHFWFRLVVLIFFMICNFYAQMFEYISLSNGFFMGLGTILLTGIVVVLAFFTSQEHPKVVAALLALLVFGIFTGVFNFFLGGLLVFTYLTEIPECSKAKWVSQQPGYPYFSDRFENQKLHSDYRPDHKIDSVRDAVMPGTSGPGQRASDTDDDIEAAILEMRRKRRAERERREAEAARHQYVIRPGETDDTMPGIALGAPEENGTETAPQQPVLPADAPEKFPEPAPVPEPLTFSESAPLPAYTPLPEPELPKDEDIPLPVWDVPEPSFPDPVTDTSVILSDFPEISGDIPDLPEIPDIPKL